MNTREYYDLFRYLMEKCCLPHEDLIFVENISDWCREHNISEPDKEKPIKLIVDDDQGCKVLIKGEVLDQTIEERINAVRIRNQVMNVAFEKTDKLDTPHKKLAFLFLNEYAYSLPDVDDDLLADEWAFNEMERLGYFKT